MLYEVITVSEIRVLGFSVNVDTRPDLNGFQPTMTSVKNLPASVDTFVGVPGPGDDDNARIPATLPEGFLVKAKLSGPDFTDGQTVITSYSIHYTKLYENVFREIWSHRKRNALEKKTKSPERIQNDTNRAFYSSAGLPNGVGGIYNDGWPLVP